MTQSYEGPQSASPQDFAERLAALHEDPRFLVPSAIGKYLQDIDGDADDFLELLRPVTRSEMSELRTAKIHRKTAEVLHQIYDNEELGLSRLSGDELSAAIMYSLSQVLLVTSRKVDALLTIMKVNSMSQQVNEQSEGQGEEGESPRLSDED